jgi:hypothetical protein
MALVLGLAASAYGAVGDLTCKGCDPNEGGGWYVRMTGGQDVNPAPADCGTVNPKAKLITLHTADMTAPGKDFKLRVAVDSARADATILDVLRVDAGGTGKFTADASIAFKWPAADGTGAASIGPLAVKLTRDGRQVPVLVRGYITGSTGGVASLYLSFGACLEGECAFGDKVRTVRLVDTTGHLKMEHPATVVIQDGLPRNINPGDAIMIGGADGRFTRAGFFGQPIFIDGTWYDLAVSADNTKVTAAPTKGPFGRIKLDADPWSVMLISTDRILFASGGKEPALVPAGKYYVQSASLTRSGSTASLTDFLVYQGKAKAFEVVEGKVTENPVGPPFTSRVVAQQNDRTVMLEPTLTDPAGRSVTNILRTMMLEPDPADPSVTRTLVGVDSTHPMGRFEVTDAGGKLVYSADMVFS